MALLLYSKAVKDAIAAAWLRLARARPDLGAALSLEDLIGQSTISQRDDGGYRFGCAADAKARIAAARPLLNRAFISAATLAERPIDCISEPSLQTELESALLDAIGACPDTTARPGMYSLCGDHLPLYLQWQRMNAACPDLPTPRYAYAFGSVAPEVGEFSHPIYKSAYDLRAWKPNSPPSFWWHTFVVERPAGQPIIASVIGMTVLLHGLVEAQSVYHRIVQVSRQICREFGSAFGEILYFVSGETVTFAAFSHVMATDFPASEVDSALQGWLEHRQQAAAT